MAITLVGSAENSAPDGADVTVTLPAGVQEDDLVLVAYGISSADNQAMQISTSGYTQLAEVFVDAAFGEDCNLGVFYKIMGASPDANVVCVGSGTVNNPVVAVVQVWRGVDQVVPIDVTTVTATGTTTQPNSPSTSDPVTDEALVVSAVANQKGNDEGAVSAPTGYTNLVDEGLADVFLCTIAMASKVVTPADAEDPDSWSGFTATGASGWCAATVVLRPASEAEPLPVPDVSSYAPSFPDSAPDVLESVHWEFRPATATDRLPPPVVPSLASFMPMFLGARQLPRMGLAPQALQWSTEIVLLPAPVPSVVSYQAVLPEAWAVREVRTPVPLQIGVTEIIPPPAPPTPDPGKSSYIPVFRPRRRS